MSSIRSVSLLQRVWRIVCLAGWLSHTSWLIFGFNNNNKVQRAQKLRFIAQRLLQILHVELEVNKAQSSFDGQQTALVVANHVSWLDIFVLFTQCQGSFIAKQSIQHWPLIGMLTKNVGVIFIDRDSRTAINVINQKIATALSSGQSVLFFPEARTSDGLTVLPFKTALFQSALTAHTPVQAIALRYYNEDDERTTLVSYAGRTNLLASLWRIISLTEIKVKVDYAPLIDTATAADLNRYDLKSSLEAFVVNTVNSDSPLK